MSGTIPHPKTRTARPWFYKATFSENVTGVTASDFVLSQGSTGRVSGITQVTVISGSGDTYHVTVSSSTDGTYNLDLVLSGHNIADACKQPADQHGYQAQTRHTPSDTAVIVNTNPRLASIERHNARIPKHGQSDAVTPVTFSLKVAL